MNRTAIHLALIDARNELRLRQAKLDAEPGPQFPADISGRFDPRAVVGIILAVAIAFACSSARDWALSNIKGW